MKKHHYFIFFFFSFLAFISCDTSVISSNISNDVLNSVSQKKYRNSKIDSTNTITFLKAEKIKVEADKLVTGKKYKNAEKKFNEALAILNSQKNTKAEILLKKYIYEQLAFCAYNLNNHECFTLLDNALKIKDSLQKVDFERIIAELEKKHNVDLIKQEGEKKRLLEIQKKERFQTLSAALIILLAGSFVGFFIYRKNARLKRKNISLELIESDILKEKEINRINTENQIKILNTELDAKDAERKLVSETLHDSVSASISATILHLKSNRKDHAVSKEILEAEELLKDVYQEIRKLSHKLIPSLLIKFGLGFALENFCDNNSNSQIKISFSEKNIQRYDLSFEINISTIIEMYVHNILEKTKSSIEIYLEETKELISIEIKNDLKNSLSSEEKKSLKLAQIKDRIKTLQGVFHTHIVENKTVVAITIPLPKSENN